MDWWPGTTVEALRLLLLLFVALVTEFNTCRGSQSASGTVPYPQTPAARLPSHSPAPAVPLPGCRSVSQRCPVRMTEVALSAQYLSMLPGASHVVSSSRWSRLGLLGLSACGCLCKHQFSFSLAGLCILYLQARSLPPPAFVNKVLLAHGPLFLCVWSRGPCAAAELSSCSRDCAAPSVEHGYPLTFHKESVRTPAFASTWWCAAGLGWAVRALP